MRAADPRCDLLDELTRTAFRLGQVFGREAEQAETHARRIEFFHLFDRCFTSVRLGIALQLRLNREGAVRPMVARPNNVVRPEAPECPEALEQAEREPPDHAAVVRPERYDERDREREAERATFPMLLRSLNGVVAAAEALPGPPPAELPTLRELLQRVGATSATVAAPASHGPAGRPASLRPAAPPAGPLRARLSGGAATVTLTRPAGSPPRGTPLPGATLPRPTLPRPTLPGGPLPRAPLSGLGGAPLTTPLAHPSPRRATGPP